MNLIINVFAGRFLDNVLQQSSTEGLSVGKLRIIDRIIDKLQTELEPLEKYQMTKDIFTLENNIKQVMKAIVGAEEKQRKELIEKLLSTPSHFAIPEENKYNYAFEENILGGVKRKHWVYEKHPNISIKLTTKEEEVLKEIFDDSKTFPEQSAVLITLITDSLQNLKEE